MSLSILCCPDCGHELPDPRTNTALSCRQCSRAFSSDHGIALLFSENQWNRKDVTKTIKSFYEETPFPDYEDLDSIHALREKSEKGVFARLLDRQIPYGSIVLEAGCGTGQLSNFLGLTSGRVIFGSDMCLNSLRLAQNFKDKNDISNVSFIQMNLFKPAFKAESFDYVVCNGVLHHTSDPELGFKSLLGLVKKGGHIVIGLYHRYGRIRTDMRRALFNLSGNRLKSLDPYLRQKKLGSRKKNSWFMDQYKNPHESKHTFGDVLKWFNLYGVDFVKSIPKSVPFVPFDVEEKLFEPETPGGTLEHFLVEMGMLIRGDKEGGFFIMIGKKKS